MKKNLISQLMFLVFALVVLQGLTVHPLFAKEKPTEPGKASIRLDLSSKDSVKAIKAFLIRTDAEGKETPIEKVDIKFYVQRTFSLLPLKEGNTTTNEQGLAFAVFPPHLPGDSAGNVTVIARLEDNDDLGELSATGTVNWGKPVKFENTMNQRALWASSNSAPWSLVIFVSCAVIGVWGIILFVVTQLFRINRLGNNEDNSQL